MWNKRRVEVKPAIIEISGGPTIIQFMRKWLMVEGLSGNTRLFSSYKNGDHYVGNIGFPSVGIVF